MNSPIGVPGPTSVSVWFSLAVSIGVIRQSPRLRLYIIGEMRLHVQNPLQRHAVLGFRLSVASSDALGGNRFLVPISAASGNGQRI
jgi:hypothetical protein